MGVNPIREFESHPLRQYTRVLRWNSRSNGLVRRLAYISAYKEGRNELGRARTTPRHPCTMFRFEWVEV
jgi:hypothetical protein